MSGGLDLGGAAAPPRKRGRPKGSTNKRARDLKGYIEARFGGSAAQQSAALCMVTPAELKRAGGSMAKAQVSKAVELVEHVRQAQEGFDERLRDLVRHELRDLAAEIAAGGRVRELVNAAIGRIREGSSRFGLAEAMKLIATERSALLPYTDQRQPLAIETTSDAFRPAFIAIGAPVEKAHEIPVIEGQVSHVKSHDPAHQLEFLGETDG